MQVFVLSGRVLEMLHISEIMPRMLCAVNAVCETCRSACGCSLARLHFVHGNARLCGSFCIMSCGYEGLAQKLKF